MPRGSDGSSPAWGNCPARSRQPPRGGQGAGGRLSAVPRLVFDDAPPARPSRVLVAGTSGSGKTTLAGRIGVALGLPHTEIDALFHGPGWTKRPTFEADVAALAARPEWVTEWQYRAVRPFLADRADLLVWLDPPVAVVMGQLLRRTLTRRLRRQELWNGNIEPPLATILTDPEHILRWGWNTRHQTAQRVESLAGSHPGLPVVHLRSRREARAWLVGPVARVA